jgi:uncharacterized damage-inducible protein DinB
MSVESLFLNASVTKLTQFNERIGICLGKLTDDQIWARGHENENAVGNLVLHLSGNVRQWIMHGLGGQPDVRVRDREFSAQGGMSAAELAALLSGTVGEATAVISAFPSEQLTRPYEIQARKVSGLEAVLNVVEHFAQHTGQIVYATKNLTGQDLGLVMPRKRPTEP